jgi:hypothetical protein
MIKDYTLVAWVATILGAALVILSKSSITENSQISGFCIGAGAALAALGIGHLAGRYAIKAVVTPEIQEASLREEKDERNIRIRERAGWNASRITIYILCFLALASALMNLELYVTILIVSLIIIESSLVAGSLVYYEKRI